jgi:nucleoside-diphosphate-sugar epimerase
VIKIRGDGEQVRTYAPVEKAVQALLDAVAGRTTVISGTDYSVNQLAAMHPHKKVTRVPARNGDLKVVTQ